MDIRSQLILLFTLLAVNLNFSQSSFNLIDARSDKIKFQLIDNLIVIPVEVNGVELSFLLDTGVSKPILFNIVNLEDSLKINQVESIFLQGLGGGASVEALKSQKNLVRIGDAINVNQDLYVILDEAINFTPRLGIPIHGIIGYDLFKDFIVEINYSRKFIRLYYPDLYEYRNCNKCETLSLSFYNNKPYLEAMVGIREKDIPIKLLIDT
ncbi:MAG: retropepsin-like aspartic protease, partial [Flavobacteriaceae bacterium]|nr:retropepsin-like aspartic protease [Flavobacteriaceae bacterium]